MRTTMTRSFAVFTFLAGTVVGLAVAFTIMRDAAAQDSDYGVSGIGGVFFKADDPESLRAWYALHLGVGPGAQGVNFVWRDSEIADEYGMTVWSVFPADTDYFGPGDQSAMINYRVRDLDLLLARLGEAGVEQVGELEEYPYGRFAWIVDGEGNRVELWEPVNFDPADLE